MRFNTFIITTAIIGLTACSTIQPTAESSKVTLVKPGNVKECVKLGTTHATLTYKIDIVTLNEEATTEKLVTVAKNRAAKLGGDSIVAQGPAVDNTMSFDVYKCGE